jgi:hypothetical protein
MKNTHCQNRVRVTYQVQADGAGTQPTTGFTTRIGPPAAPGVAGAVTLGPVNLPANWLLAAGYEEMLWADFAGTVAYPGAGVAPAGAPTMRPIAANRYVRTNGGQTTGPILGGADPKNAKCLGVEVRFGNFRYYVAGDIETPQENSIQQLLNNERFPSRLCLAGLQYVNGPGELPGAPGQQRSLRRMRRVGFFQPLSLLATAAALPRWPATWPWKTSQPGHRQTSHGKTQSQPPGVMTRSRHPSITSCPGRAAAPTTMANSRSRTCAATFSSTIRPSGCLSTSGRG